jgi:ubiquinone/menaquinone biosynthesis C-methylase UbiE
MNRATLMKSDNPAQSLQKKFNFSPPQPRPFLGNLPGKIDAYEEGVASFFRWKTGLDYYLTMDQIVDFVVSTGRLKVVDLLADTAVFALRLAGRKAFHGRIYSFDSNVTLLERAKQRSVQLNLQSSLEFKHFQEPLMPLADGFGDAAVSIFDLHRHSAEQYLAEIYRILMPNGHFILAEFMEPKSAKDALPRFFRNMWLRYMQKNHAESCAVYPDREEIIQLLFDAGFRQVIVQELESSGSRISGVFGLIAATK